MAPLHAAVKRGLEKDVEKLIAKFDETGSPDLNGFDNQGRTALQYAAELGFVRIAFALIDAGAEPVRRARADREGPAALHFAAQNGHVAMVKLLIDSLTGFDRSSHAESYSEDYTIDSVASMLSSNGAYLDTEMTPLLLACRAGHAAAAMELIAAGADIHARSGTNGRTLLHFSCAHRGPAMLPAIHEGLRHGLRDAKSQYGGTALGVAADRGCVEAIRALLDAGGTANDLNLVSLAAGHGHVDAVRAFLEHAKARNIEIPRLTEALDAAAEEALRCVRLGATWGGDGEPSVRLRQYGRVVALLVAAGDRRWDKVPLPCRGLEAALPAVLETAPDELPELFERLETPMQDRIRFVLLALQRLFPVPGDYFLRRAVLAYALADDDGDE